MGRSPGKNPKKRRPKEMSRCLDKVTEFFPRSPLSRLSSLCLNLQLIYVVSMLWIGEAAAGKPLDVDDAKVVKSNIDRGEACNIRNIFNIEEATIDDIQFSFTEGSLTSHQLVRQYLNKIQSYNHVLHAVIEVNPDALKQAKRADWERKKRGNILYKGLHGILILVKDNIATKDRLNTTAGSLALLGSIVPRDAGVVHKLRRAGAIILGKASMSEWANFRSLNASNGWSARGGQGKNPYVLSADPCGSSSGSAIAVAANMAAVALGTETSGSIICPASANSVVGIKPTVGITSSSGVIPISPRQDTVGPIARTVIDAVVVLEATAGFDERDADATQAALKYIPKGGYMQFLNVSGMKGKRVGILRKGFFEFGQGTVHNATFEQHFKLMRQQGAVSIDNLEIPNISIINDFMQNGELLVLPAEFKISLDMYLSELLYSPVKSLLDVINFNNKHAVEEKMTEIGQFIFLVSQNTSGIGPLEESAIEKMKQLSINGIEKVMHGYRLDAIVTPNADASTILAIGGYSRNFDRDQISGSYSPWRCYSCFLGLGLLFTKETRTFTAQVFSVSS